MKLVKGVRKFFFAILALSLFSGCGSARKVEQLGLQNKQLRPCPDSPNCISSMAAEKRAQVSPLKLKSPPQQAWEQVKSTITALPRTRIITATPEYLHAECRSAVFGFIDDLELHLRPKQAQIDIRSAARLGYYDFGVNRERVEQLRERLHIAGVVR